MVPYKSHYACFTCRKAFKRRLLRDINRNETQEKPALCPDCGSMMADMGKDFEAPKKDDIKKWRHFENLYQVGISFHSCGCTGPGFIPKDKEQLKKYFEDILSNYQKNLAFFRNRTEPKNNAEVQREISKNAQFIYGLPDEIRDKKQNAKNEEAKNYWIEKIKSVEEKLRWVEGNV